MTDGCLVVLVNDYARSGSLGRSLTRGAYISLLRDHSTELEVGNTVVLARLVQSTLGLNAVTHGAVGRLTGAVLTSTYRRRTLAKTTLVSMLLSFNPANRTRYIRGFIGS